MKKRTGDTRFFGRSSIVVEKGQTDRFLKIARGRNRGCDQQPSAQSFAPIKEKLLIILSFSRKIASEVRSLQ